MANVIPAAESRGQLLLITGVVVAVALVGIALVLNSVIFTENIATRNDDHESYSVLDARSNVESDLAEGIARVNDDVVTSTTFDWLEENLTYVVADRNAVTSRRSSLGGAVVNLSVASVTEGSRIRQTNASRNLTAGDEMAGEDDWTVAEDVEDFGHFRLTAKRGSMYESTIDTTKSALAESAFYVNVTDGNGDVWKVYLFRGTATNNVYVLVEDPDDADFSSSTEGYEEFVTESCQYTNDTVSIWFTKGIVENRRCEQLSFFDDEAVPPYDIEYYNVVDDTTGSDRIRGTYDVLFEQSITRSPSPFYASSTGESPFTQKAIFSSEIHMTYRSFGTEFSTDIDVGSRRNHPGLIAENPSVENFAIHDDQSTSTEVRYEVDWSVSDRNADLKEVELILTETTGDSVLDSETITVTGISANDRTTLSYTGSDLLSTEHRIEIVVKDEHSGVDSDVIIDTADGSP